jgi:glycosyltransferase involved in cell wall biosynthesis
MRKVASVVLNSFTNDNRVLKENLSLKKANFQVIIIALCEDGLKEEEEIEGIFVKRIKLKSKDLPKSFFFSAVKYIEFLFKAFSLTKGYHFVHCNDLETLPIGCLRKKVEKKIKIIYDAHEFEIYRTTAQSSKKVWLNKFIEKKLIKCADTVITVSDSIADAYKEMYPIKRPEIIYNCPFKSRAPNPKKNLFREKFNIRSDQRIFLYQGALTTGRGINQILETFKTLESDQYVVIFMGYGVYKNKIIEVSNSCNTVFFQKAVPIHEINDYSNSADWGLLTIENVSISYNFSLPNKLFEYAMAEIPIIAFPTIEIKNKITQYKIGFVTEDESSEALMKAIEFTDSIDRAIYIKGFTKMKDEFNWENQEKKLLKIYNSNI